MRALVVIDSLATGGAEVSLAILAPHFPACGVELHVAQLKQRPGLQARLGQAGATVHDLSARPGRVRWSQAVSALCHRLHPDIVNTVLFEADIAGRIGARLARIPVVSTLATEHYGPTHLALPHLSAGKVRAAQVLDAATARLTRRLHAVSHQVADSMARHLWYPSARIDVIPRAREPVEPLNPTARAELRGLLGAADGDLVVLAVARNDNVKGLDVLVEAVGQLRRAGEPVKLWIAGREGNATPLLLELVADNQLGAAASLLGNRDDVGDLLMASDVFALPSRREGSPGALLEAMAAGAQIVATDLPSVRELVDERDAVLVPSEQPGLLAAAIKQIRDAPDAALARSRHAAERFHTRHRPLVVAEQTRAFYERALA